MAVDKPKPTKLITPVFRGSFVTLVKARSIEEGQTPKYSILAPLSKTNKEATAFIAKLRAEIARVVLAKFGKAIPEKALKHFPIRDGDTMEQEGFAGHWCISASNKFKPGVVDGAGNKLFSEEDLYSGAWYRASISVWAWSHKTGGKGVSINLDNVLKTKDDEKIGGGTKAEDDFKSYLDTEGATEGDAADEPAAAGADDEDLYG